MDHILALRQNAGGFFTVRVTANELGPEAAKLANFFLEESYVLLICVRISLILCLFSILHFQVSS